MYLYKLFIIFMYQLFDYFLQKSIINPFNIINIVITIQNSSNQYCFKYVKIFSLIFNILIQIFLLNRHHYYFDLVFLLINFLPYCLNKSKK